jgi:hypothetical protein
VLINTGQILVEYWSNTNTGQVQILVNTTGQIWRADLDALPGGGGGLLAAAARAAMLSDPRPLWPPAARAALAGL